VIQITSFASYFPKDINFFNDQLPTLEYFDLRNILEKYDYLDKSKSMNILVKWKKALEDVQQALGQYEIQILGIRQLNEKIENMFFKQFNSKTKKPTQTNMTDIHTRRRYQQQQGQGIHFRQTGQATLTFSMPCKEENLPHLQTFASMLYCYYTPSNPQDLGHYY
jgi:hypothetical protein